MAQQQQEIPVYLFTGFLECGKTTFIQQTLEDDEFCPDAPALVLICEQGEVELQPERFPAGKVFIHEISDQSELTEANLTAWLAEHNCGSVVVEYNGMWQLTALYDAMPESWIIYQEFVFFHAPTFLTYNKNMRGLVVDKLTSCDLAVFNRYTDDVDKMMLHRIARATNRRCDIAYEDPNENVEYDDIIDPLPFDINAAIVEINERDYALWYQDLAEETLNYHNKTVRFMAMVITKTKMPSGRFIAGRPVMACCAEDIQFGGLICRWAKCSPLPNRSWAVLTARVSVERKPDGQLIPELSLREITPCPKPEQEVATFF